MFVSIWWSLIFASLWSKCRSQDNIIPIIDISLLKSASLDSFCVDVAPVAAQIHQACQHVGFFYISGHGVPEEIIDSLDTLSRTFFSLPEEVKYKIAMDKGGKAWRGYFGVGDEVTSGIPDQKEGIYFGTELDNNDPRPMHGSNIWPEGELGLEMKRLVLAYMSEMKQLGRLLMKAIACSLGITEPHFLQQFNAPTELFRIFNYPPHNPDKFSSQSLGV